MFKQKCSMLSLAAMIAAAPLVASQSAAAESGYELRAYFDRPGGKELAAGDYAGAIVAAARLRSRANETLMLVAATNLCVAYTATGAWSDARPACDDAVTLARRADLRGLRSFTTGVSSAQALSNRGVLRALDGDSVGAVRDFEAAGRLRGASAAVDRNLARLRTAPAVELAVVDSRVD